MSEISTDSLLLLYPFPHPKELIEEMAEKGYRLNLWEHHSAEEVQKYIAELEAVKVRPVYEFKIFP